MKSKFTPIFMSWLFLCAPVLANEKQLGENAIIESLLLFAFSNNVSAGQKNVEYFFIRIKDADPSEELLSRFAEYEPKVRSISESILAKDKSIIHKSTGSRGIVFWVQSIKWVTEEKVVVPWGYYEGSLSASGNEAILEYKEGKWVVREDRLLIISEARPNNQLQPTGFAGG